MFVDTATIEVRAGSGGSGCASFRRERGVPRGGPDGGDGGRGGDVIVQVDAHMRTLLDFKRYPHLKAGRGMHGQGSNKTGAAGKDVIIQVPVGTVIIDTGSGRVIADLIEPDASTVVAQGGRGGRGNARFASSINQAPRQWERRCGARGASECGQEHTTQQALGGASENRRLPLYYPRTESRPRQTWGMGKLCNGGHSRIDRGGK